jgi:hypothetical protein
MTIIRLLLLPLVILGYIMGLLFSATKHGFVQAQKDINET